MTRQMPSQVSTRTDPPAPLKVLHVFYELRYSGGEVMIRVASGLWAQKGIECTIAAVADVVGPYADTLESAGYRVHRLPPSAPRMLTSFSRLLRSLKPHVVHLHVERANFWLALEALVFGTRVVQTVHNCLSVHWRLADRAHDSASPAETLRRQICRCRPKCEPPRVARLPQPYGDDLELVRSRNVQRDD